MRAPGAVKTNRRAVAVLTHASGEPETNLSSLPPMVGHDRSILVHEAARHHLGKAPHDREPGGGIFRQDVEQLFAVYGDYF